MAVILKCSACRQKMKVAEYFHGTTVTCRSCAQSMQVPTHVYRDAAVRPQTAAALEEREILPERGGRYAVRIRRNARHTWRGSKMVIGSVVPYRLLLVALAASLFCSAAYLTWRHLTG